MTKPYTHRDAVAFRPLDWTGVHPTPFAGPVPNHVAVVMDGNGRWANKRGMSRIEGHQAGRRCCSTSWRVRSRPV